LYHFIINTFCNSKPQLFNQLQFFLETVVAQFAMCTSALKK